MQKQIFPPQRDHARGGTTLLTGTIIIVTAAVILFGGVFGYQYFFIKNNQNQVVIQTNSQQQTNNIQTTKQEQQSNQQKNTVSPTNETASWKKYSNSNYKYSIEYPANWYLEKNSSSNGIVYSLAFSNYPKEANSNPPKDLYLFGLGVIEIDPQTTYDDILQGYKPYNYTAQQNIDIDGIKSIKLTKTTTEYIIKSSTNTFESTSVHIFTKSDTNLFHFIYYYENPYTGERVAQDKIDMAEKTISTFKFTK